LSDSIDKDAPAWLVEAQGFLAEKVRHVYVDQKQEDMPQCFGQIMDFGAGENSYKVLPIPQEYDKHQAYACFKFVLAETLKSPEFGPMMLGGFTIMEGWELDPEKDNQRTGRTVVVTNIETPDGWNAMQAWVVEDHQLIDHARLIDRRFESEPRGNLQGMFDAQRQAQ
jgi:hypothetical protein